MNLDLIKIINTEDGRFIAIVNEINYLVSEDVYTIIKEKKEERSIEEIKITLNKKGKNYTTAQITELIDVKLPGLLKENFKIDNPVKNLGTVCETTVFKKYRVITDKLFLNKLFYTLFFSHLFFSFFFIYKYWFFFDSIFQLKKDWFVTFLFTFFIMFIHELGHVIAAIKFEIKPPRIGFGYYFIYPAMFTDLTEAWCLKKQDRIVINLSGMYFQLFINTILIILFYLKIFDEFFIFSFIFSNLMIVFFNLNPLFKFDGYWIFSDFFDLPNLRTRANSYLIRFFKSENREEKKTIKLYAFSFLVFMITVWIFLSLKFYTSIRIIFNMDIEFHNKLGSVITILLILLIIYNLLKSKFKKKC
jgi:putative peptide zinc metalloprotease protein